MKNNLRISNIIMTGKLPFKSKLSHKDYLRMINKSNLFWQMVNEENSPIFQTHIDKEGTNVHGRQKSACISLWAGGAINIVGITSVMEGNKVYEKVFREVKRLCPGVFT